MANAFRFGLIRFGFLCAIVCLSVFGCFFPPLAIQLQACKILTLFFDALRLSTLDALILSSAIACTVYRNSRKWIAYQLNDLILTCHFTTEFVWKWENRGWKKICNVFEMQEIKKCILLRYTEKKKPGVLMAGDVEVKFDRKIETTKNLAG